MGDEGSEESGEGQSERVAASLPFFFMKIPKITGLVNTFILETARSSFLRSVGDAEKIPRSRLKPFFPFFFLLCVCRHQRHFSPACRAWCQSGQHVLAGQEYACSSEEPNM